MVGRGVRYWVACHVLAALVLPLVAAAAPIADAGRAGTGRQTARAVLIAEPSVGDLAPALISAIGDYVAPLGIELVALPSALDAGALPNAPGGGALPSAPDAGAGALPNAPDARKEALPAPGLTGSLERYLRAAQGRSAFATVVLDRDADVLTLLVIDARSGRALVRRVRAPVGNEATAVEEASVIVRSTLGGLIEGGEIDVQGEPAPLPSPSPSTQVRPVSAPRFRVRAGYSGLSFSEDVPWSSGARLAGALSFGERYYVAAGAALFPSRPIRSQPARLDFGRTPFELTFGVESAPAGVRLLVEAGPVLEWQRLSNIEVPGYAVSEDAQDAWAFGSGSGSSGGEGASSNGDSSDGGSSKGGFCAGSGPIVPLVRGGTVVRDTCTGSLAEQSKETNVAGYLTTDSLRSSVGSEAARSESTATTSPPAMPTSAVPLRLPGRATSCSAGCSRWAAT